MQVTVATSTEHTFSVFAKERDLDWLGLQTVSFTTPANSLTYFDLNNKATGTVGSGHSAGIEALADGWCRCWITFTTDAADTAGELRMYPCDGDGGVTVDLDDTSNIYIADAQFEVGSYPSSPVRSYASQVTRNADNVSIATADVPFVDGAGTIFTKLTPEVADDRRLMVLNDGSDSNRHLLYTVAGRYKALTQSSSSTQATTTMGTPVAGTAVHLGYAFDTDDIQAAQDGTAYTADVSATLPVGRDNFRVGSDETGTPFQGTHHLEMHIAGRRVTEAELETGTTL